jgi:tetratricopeptide (TPR) repeat protein
MIANRGSSLAAHGDHARALGAYRLAINLEPALIPAYVALGQSLEALGRKDEAAAVYARVRELLLRRAPRP